MVDIAPYGNESADLEHDVQSIAHELEEYSRNYQTELHTLDRWLVINKIDTVLDEDRDRIASDLLAALDWQGPVYEISAVAREGTQALVNDIMQWLQERDRSEEDTPLVSIPATDMPE